MTDSAVLYTISPSNDSTLAIEVFKTGLMRKKKHILFFERFEGRLSYVPQRPEASRVEIWIDAKSAVCRDAWLGASKQQAVTRYARDEAIQADGHPEIQFVSSRISPKELRGFVVEGELNVRGIRRMVKVNVVLSSKKFDRFQVDGDANVCLSDFGIERPSRMLGLAGTKDEALVRILLWAVPNAAVANA